MGFKPRAVALLVVGCVLAGAYTARTADAQRGKRRIDVVRVEPHVRVALKTPVAIVPPIRRATELNPKLVIALTMATKGRTEAVRAGLRRVGLSGIARGEMVGVVQEVVAQQRKENRNEPRGKAHRDLEVDVVVVHELPKKTPLAGRTIVVDTLLLGREGTATDLGERASAWQESKIQQLWEDPTTRAYEIESVPGTSAKHTVLGGGNSDLKPVLITRTCLRPGPHAQCQ